MRYDPPINPRDNRWTRQRLTISRTPTRRIRPFAVETPLLEFGVLNEKLGGRIFCKAEPLQRTGSFKFRGAYNRVSRVDRAAYPGGVVACSSGNHAQGVAEAARLCGVDAVIVMPSDAPKIKIARTSQCGAEIVFYDRETEDRNAIARDLCEKLHADFVPPFDDPVVIAGQGTAWLEMTRQAKAAGAGNRRRARAGQRRGPGGRRRDRGQGPTFPTPRSGAWSRRASTTTSARWPRERGSRNEPSHRSICDALLMPEPGELTFAVNKTLLAGGLAVGDTDVRHAVAYAWRDMKLVLEPGGAVALAALLSGAFDANGRTVAIVLVRGKRRSAPFRGHYLQYQGIGVIGPMKKLKADALRSGMISRRRFLTLKRRHRRSRCAWRGGRLRGGAPFRPDRKEVDCRLIRRGPARRLCASAYWRIFTPSSRGWTRGASAASSSG